MQLCDLQQRPMAKDAQGSRWPPAKTGRNSNQSALEGADRNYRPHAKWETMERNEEVVLVIIPGYVKCEGAIEGYMLISTIISTGYHRFY